MSDTPLKMPHTYRAIIVSKCVWCGAEIMGLKTRKYCHPKNGKTKSRCAIDSAAAERAVKKEK